MTRQRRPLALVEQPEAVMEAGRDQADVQRVHAGRGEFDRQRQPVQFPADLGNRASRIAIEPEAGTHGGCPFC